MSFSKKNGKKVLEQSHEIGDLKEYIRWIVNVYSAALVLREMWLTEWEKDFFIAVVIHLNQGIDNPISVGAMQIYKKYFDSEVTKRGINNLIRKIQKKEWVEYDKEGRHIKVPSIFYGIDTNQDSFEFKLNIKYEAD